MSLVYVGDSIHERIVEEQSLVLVVVVQDERVEVVHAVQVVVL